MRRLAQTWTLIVCLVIVLASCSRGSAPDVLTTTTILADVARNVTGDRLTVRSLLPPGIDPHSYQPVPQDAAKIKDSNMLVFHGGEYERFLNGLLETAGGPGRMVEASRGVRFRSGADGVDPHVWLDPTNVIVYVDNIREGLTEVDPDGAEIYQTNASTYIDQLVELDAWINEQVAQIQPQHRATLSFASLA